MNVLILGSGGREHTFAKKIKESNKLSQLYVMPGNAGTASIAENISEDPMDFELLKKHVLEKAIDMVVVGPEAPLVSGVHDFFLNDSQLKNIPVIGPQKEGAQLEGSKDYSKAFMYRHQIPTAAYQTFTANDLEAGKEFLETLSPPYVLKADGLAAGKGVLILEDLDQAKQELEEMLKNLKFGAASSKVVIESFLDGIELSVFVLTDGHSYKILPAAKDYKRIGEGDTGLNTGGMGAISPVPFADSTFLNKVEEKVVKPTVNGLKKDNIPFKGFLFIGLMNCDGEPFVVEYNVRMGDPETEVVLPRLDADLLDLFEGVAQNNLESKSFAVKPDTAVTVMTVSGGYPEAYEKGKIISGLDMLEGVTAYHAGTTLDNQNNILTNGGRVLTLTATASNRAEALSTIYKQLEKIEFEGIYYRKDIGFDLN